MVWKRSFLKCLNVQFILYFFLHIGFSCAIRRLRYQISLMEQCPVLCCRNCGELIAKQEDIFSMSSEGPQGAYVNPGGYVHETLTLYKTKNLNLVGESSTQYSWFPGYLSFIF